MMILKCSTNIIGMLREEEEMNVAQGAMRREAPDKKQFLCTEKYNEEDAANAYNEAAIKIHGEFANLNTL